MKKTSRYNYNGNKCEQCQKDITRNARLCRHCSKQIYDKILTKEHLYQQYIINGKTIAGIAKQIGCGRWAVHTRLKKFNIKTRSISEVTLGKNNPFYRKKHNKNSRLKISKSNKGKLNGKNNPSWNGGSSFEPYSSSWTKDLKKEIRKRDNHTCQLCGMKEEEYNCHLDVHHIDYDKKNCAENNLICLCKNCHMKTNQYRRLWKTYLSLLMENKLPTRAGVVKQLKISFSEKDIVISSLGMTSRTVEAIFKSNNHFPLVGGMGGALAISIGIALNTKKKVWAILGDGESLMGLESFIMVNKLKLKNLKIFILDNGVHASTGGQGTISKFVNFVSLCSNIIHLKISPEKGDAPRIPLTPIQIKERFKNAINNL